MREKRKIPHRHQWGLVLLIVGVVIASYPLFTWGYSYYHQRQLQASLVSLEEPQNDGIMDENCLLDDELKELTVETVEDERQDAFLLLEIPKLDLSVAVVKGTSDNDLRKAPGWYKESVLPGEGNTAIAGHRTMHGAWFRHVDSLKKGDDIIVFHQGQPFKYEVERVFVVAKDDWRVIDPTPYPSLTLTTCHPVGSARQRLIVRAGLVQ